MTMQYLVGLAPTIGAIFEVLTVLVASLTALFGYRQYRQQNALQRFEKLEEMRRLFDGRGEFGDICTLLDKNDSQGLRAVHFKDKITFLGFFEDVALMRNSGLISDQLAHYMFGYYAILCFDSTDFWEGNDHVKRDSYYWSLFSSFVTRMKETQKIVASAKPDIQQLRV